MVGIKIKNTPDRETVSVPVNLSYILIPYTAFPQNGFISLYSLFDFCETVILAAFKNMTRRDISRGHFRKAGLLKGPRNPALILKSESICNFLPFKAIMFIMVKKSASRKTIELGKKTRPISGGAWY